MRAPYLNDGDVRLYLGDCIEVMREMDAESVDAVVCDPPYGLEFMGKEWDSFGAKRSPSTAGRSGDGAVIGGAGIGSDRRTPGSRSRISFGGGRPMTWRCNGCGKRDQFRGTHGDCEGWTQEVIDPDAPAPLSAFAAWCETWAREALRVLKPGGHLLAFGGTRTFHRLTCGIEDAGFEIRDCLSWMYGSGFPKSLDVSKAIDKAAGADREVVGVGGAACEYIERGEACRGHGDTNGRYGETVHAPATAPATDAAREWQGWGTALKPGWEPCVVARKPLAGTVAENVQQHGTGALNIDGCRINVDPALDASQLRTMQRSKREGGDGWGMSTVQGDAPQVVRAEGRWPANVAFDEEAAAMLDGQTGVMKDGVAVNRNRGEVKPQTVGNVPARINDHSDVGYGGSGGASRFFYTAKASRADRNAGGMAENTHPTVKPTDLMRWLVRLVTPPGGVVLDPFAGSGTTLVAARAEGFRAIGIEREEEYARIIADRLSQLSLFSEAS